MKVPELPLVKLEIIPAMSGYVLHEHRQGAGGKLETLTHAAETLASVARQVSKIMARGRD